MKDELGREIGYLRISLTDRCNLRCRYCMPAEGIEKQCHSDILSLEEVAEIAREAVALGVHKIRLTGGEPLVRKGITELCRELAALPGVDDLALTTNGILLPKMAEELKAAGVKRLNISLDTLDAEKYSYITRGGSLAEAVTGIRAAFAAGFAPIKINTVLIGGFNDDEIPELAALTRRYPMDVRFIELMPIGEAEDLGEKAYLSNSTVLERLPELIPMESSGVAKSYRFPDGLGSVGLISPLSHAFCSECNRIRLTADGFIKPCLHSKEEIPVRGLHGEELREQLRTAIRHKPEQHGELSYSERSESQRSMNAIGG